MAETPMVFNRLRSETQGEHAAVEAFLDLAGDALTPARYRRTLELFYGFYRPLEEAIWGISGWRERGLDPDERRKIPLLEADLQALGVDAPARLPLCPELPQHGTVAECFGCLYVLEGATLGGQVITRAVRKSLGLTPETGGRFFHGYGERTGAMWRSFRDALAANTVTQGAQDEAVAAALSTFRRLRKWCEAEGLS